MRTASAFLVIPLATILGLATVAASQERRESVSPPLIIEGKAFRVGMSRQEAMALLSECCFVPPNTSSTDSAFIHRKADQAIAGAIFFQGGRVVGLRRRERQSTDRAAADFILWFYRSVLDGSAQVRTVVTIAAQPVEGANFSGRTLTFTFPDGRVLTLKHALGDDGTVSVDLEEER